ncbi:HypC/HybG/HupF family hydrogenase formation chaperone [Gaiella sp.]|jgi:hydrogenase expression/formation protein HypC|uniref:HypC/HybG/HupF family hydrogenase formation chaperone n=1 Tax=Gaiella sp. TaxID=2663207 RepID=UPI002CA1BFA3|nr:HypC/HybG/HupF family hydrogenase formation chaperone [Gaiella sp.]HWO81892.1 HypC/HybG/HupF family hydrogenase formation chaperone [Gaiella sp.]
MCLGIPGRIVDVPDRQAGLATVDISGVRRSVSVALVDEPAAPIEPGDWVLVHVGFALSRIDEAQAHETLELLRQGVELQRELDEIRHGTVT